MGAALSQNLRKWVIAAVKAGSLYRLADRFGVGIASAFRWPTRIWVVEGIGA